MSADSLRALATVLLLACPALVLGDEPVVAAGDAAGGTVFLKPLPRDVRPAANAGIFIGVNEFREDEGIDQLSFAVNDAVDLAHLFVIELKLIPAKSCFLCLSGAPAGTEARLHLEALRKAGAPVSSSASKAAILKAANQLAELAFDRERSLVAAFVSTHGILHDGVPYIVPTDGVRADLAETALRLSYFEEKIAATRAGHRVLFVDACQERVSLKSAGAGDPRSAMSPVFFEALRKKTGQAKLASCSPGESSFEHPSLQHGVFTHFLLESLRGAAPAGRDGLVRLDAVIETTKRGVKAWGEKTDRRQTIFYAGEDDARTLPLAERAEDAATLVAQLKSRVSSREGGFGEELLDRLAARIKTLRPDSESDRQLVELAREFAGGRMPEIAFVPFVRERLGLVPAAGSAAEAPGPLVAPFTATEIAAARRSWAKHLQCQESFRNALGMEFVLVPPGEYEMGTPDLQALLDRNRNTKPEYFINECPVHRVRISRPLYVSRHETTRGQFSQFVKATRYQTDAESTGKGGQGWNDEKGDFYAGYQPHYSWRSTGFPQTDAHPVVNVSWNDAHRFCDWLSTVDKKSWRLPTEAEWEYVCRAGTTTDWFSGADPLQLVRFGNVDDTTALGKWLTYSHLMFLKDNGSYVRAADGHVFTAPVGRYAANPFGLYDMHGNVWEWCRDWYDEKAYEWDHRRADDPVVPRRMDFTTSAAGERVSPPAGHKLEERTTQVYRGGSWQTSPGWLRSASRGRGSTPDFRDDDVGFRIVCTVPPGK